MHSSLIASRQSSNYDFRARPTNVPFCPFPRGYVGDFISVSSAGAAIKHFCFKGEAVHPASQCSANRANSNPSSAAPSMPSGNELRIRLLSRGPTPVRPDRLAFYLNPIQTGLFWQSVTGRGGGGGAPRTPLCISGTNNARAMKFTHNDHLHTKKPHTQF